jgi:MEKHLA domain
MGNSAMPLGPVLDCPASANDWQDAYIRRVAASFARVTGAPLVEGALNGARAWFGDFALLTHRGDDKDTMNYGNAFALALWECGWDDFTGVPSEVTAPPEDRAERAIAMQKVVTDNFVRGYRGRRISRKGRLFTIEDGVIWRLMDETGEAFGVGAFFRSTGTAA